MEKILVSACLLGENCRYDGKNNLFPFLKELNKHYELIPFCPEVASGLPIPRPKSEIRGGKVENELGEDVTKYFNAGADEIGRLARFLGISIAILKDGSPSCGVRLIHDGTFSNTKKSGMGFSAKRLESMGVKVYCESDNLSFLLPDEKEKARLKAHNIKKAEEKKAKRAAKKASPKAEASHQYKKKSSFKGHKSYKGKDDKPESKERKPFRKKGPYKGQKARSGANFSHKRNYKKKD